jgi:hypothetical protein
MDQGFGLFSLIAQNEMSLFEILFGLGILVITELILIFLEEFTLVMELRKPILLSFYDYKLNQ